VSSLSVGQRLLLEIDSLAAGGDGTARHEGRVIFVPRTAPGDRVRAEIVRVHRRFARARLLEVGEPGRGRREPPCPHAGACGGCAWMHLEEPVQQAARRDIVRDALERIGRLRDLPEFEEIAAPEPFGYRARARVAYAAGRVGFRAAGSHEIVDVERCLVLDEATQAALGALRSNPPAGAGRVEIRGFGSSVRVAGRSYRVGPGAFFQANRPLWDAWLAAVLAACGAGGVAVELYAGVGFYTAGLADRFDRVIAVERSRAARDLARNVPHRVRVEHASAESFATAKLSALTPDLVLLNPPRAGCHRSVSDAIGGARPERIVYVSCEPSTLARDLSRLTSAFRVKRVCVMNALPQTQHVETICTLERLTPRRRRS
jgi:23S rRNA (uracil1939-C5)-methyltransferase